MQTNEYDVYAEFLLACKDVMGSLDIDRLENDEEYKAEFFNNLSLEADDNLFKLADIVNRELDKT